MTVYSKARADREREAEERRQGLTTVNTIRWIRYAGWDGQDIESPPYGGRYTHLEDKDPRC